MTLNTFQFNTTPGIRFGSGQVKSSCKEIFNKLGPSILFITDKGLMSLGLTIPTIEELKKMCSVEVFDEVESDPSQKTLLLAIERGRKIKVSKATSSTTIFKSSMTKVIIILFTL